MAARPHPASAPPIRTVSGVRYRSPFRYPGGKTWLVPLAEEWLARLGPQESYLEPFAGGGSIGLAVSATGLVADSHLVELDPDVAAVWTVTLSDQVSDLVETILAFEVTADRVDAVLAVPAATVLERAFQTIVRNRTSRGGVMAQRAGRLNRGERGRGLGSRWYPQTLATRLLDIHTSRDHLRFTHGDGLEALRCGAQASGERSVTFIDPPYTAGGDRAGARLYRHCELDHDAVFAAAASWPGQVLLTYDDAPEVRDLAATYGFGCTPVTMRGNQRHPKTELLISRDQRWFDGAVRALSLALSGSVTSRGRVR